MNYRGSIGFGKGLLEGLLGKIGTQDVDDCLETLKDYIVTVNHWEMHETQLFVMGGSHGGFLTAHLASLSSSSSSPHPPPHFLAAAMRYPYPTLDSVVEIQ